MLKKFIYYSAILTFSIASLNAVHLGNLTEEDGYGKIHIISTSNTGLGLGRSSFNTDEILFKKNTVISTDEILDQETKDKFKQHLSFRGNNIHLNLCLYSEPGSPGGKLLGDLHVENLNQFLFSSERLDVEKEISGFGKFKPQ